MSAPPIAAGEMNPASLPPLLQAGEAEVVLPPGLTAAVVLVASLLITAGWLAYLYR